MVRALYFLALFAVVGVALAIRLPNLAQRPMHNDEAVNAVKFDELWRTHRFAYDPNEYHGPTLYYFTLPVVWISGARDLAQTNEVTYRMVPVIFGVGLILLLPLVTDGLGRGGTIWAGLFTAVSPAFVFYSRYYIHEMPLIFFSFAAIACGWRYRRSNRLSWALACGVFLGLTYATKETWVLALAAAAASAVTAATIWRLILKGMHHGLHFRMRAVAVGAAAFVAVFVVFFSGFFTRMRGVGDAILSYVHYSGRASGGVHDHPWNYYLSMLLWWRVKGGPVWTEGAIVAFAVLGLLLAVFRKHTVHALHGGQSPPYKNELTSEQAPAPTAFWGVHHAFPMFPPFVRFMGFYTLFLVVAFSLIPYKTPWCMLGFLHGMILMAGFACGQIIHVLPGVFAKGIGAMVFLLAAGHLGWEADRATNNFFDSRHRNYFAASRYNPYVYAHTSSDIFTLRRKMEEIAAASADGHQVSIDVVTADCWPLPFYLRGFPNTAYPHNAQQRRGADVIIGSAEDAEYLANSEVKYVASSFGLRPGVVLWIYVREELWEKMRRKLNPYEHQ
jgi:uncharacterized protein (TIGR03663 family)